MKKATTKSFKAKKPTRSKKLSVQADKMIEAIKNELGIYTISIKIFGRYYTSTGPTFLEALENLKGIGKVGGMCVLKVTKGDYTKEKIVNSRILFGLFVGSRILHEIAVKNITALFGNI